MNRRAVHADPTFDYACREQGKVLKCSGCENGKQVLKDAYRCKNNLQYPTCKREPNGFKMKEV